MAAASWQEKLSGYKTDKAAAEKEVLRSKDTYTKEKAGGATKERLDQISRWADQVRGAAGIDQNDSTYGNPKNDMPDWLRTERSNDQTNTQKTSSTSKKRSSGGGGRSSWSPGTFKAPKHSAISYDDALGRAQQQLDPIYQRAVANVQSEKAANQMQSGQVAAARGLAHSGLAADAQNKIAIAAQGHVADLDAKRASESAQIAQSLLERDEQKAMQLRAQAFQEWMGQQNLGLQGAQFGLQREQFDYGRERDLIGDQRWQQQFDYNVGRDARNDFVTDRAYNRGVLEGDRNYNRGVLESDRTYNRGVLESDRNYELTKQAQQFDEWAKRQGISINWAQLNAFRANQSADNARSASNTQYERLMDIWEKTGKAPAGIPGVTPGTPLYSSKQQSVNENDVYAEAVGQLNGMTPDQRKRFFANEEGNIIKMLGPSGYNTLYNRYFDEYGSPIQRGG